MSSQGSNHETPDEAHRPPRPKKRRPWQIRTHFVGKTGRRWWSKPITHSYATRKSRDQALRAMQQNRHADWWEYELIDPATGGEP